LSFVVEEGGNVIQYNVLGQESLAYASRKQEGQSAAAHLFVMPHIIRQQRAIRGNASI
jgi:hypothetical protein